MTENNHAAVELRGICKQYPGGVKKANNNITLDLRRGEILCIAGENGAGKTTLMKILCGLESPDAGEIFINGEKKKIDSPVAAGRLGIGMVHQHFMLFDENTAAENIVMGIEPRKWGFFFDAKAAVKNAEKIISDHDFAVKSTSRVKDLSLGEMQQVEICRALYRNAQIIILDEPTSILTEQETARLFRTLRNLVSAGKSIILITHKLHEIKQICDRAAVLRRGELIGVRDSAVMDEYEIARMMAGEEKPEFEKPQRQVLKTEPVVEFKNVTVSRRGQKHPLLDNVSFTANGGEVLGITGAAGNGIGVIEAVLGGFLHPAHGKILHRGRDISSLSIRALRNQGLAYVPADRTRLASAREMTIEENMVINRRDEFMKTAVINKKAVEEFADKLARDFNIEGARGNEKAAVLSGGNLQKLILAREINWFKDYIVFSEPSWGLDIASSRFIFGEIIKLRGRGAAVVLLSTNLDEVVALADRIIVMYKGRIAGTFENGDENAISIKEAIGNCMQGLHRTAE
jgi:simple sugar transport system ATP-binding protein